MPLAKRGDCGVNIAPSRFIDSVCLCAYGKVMWMYGTGKSD